MAAAAAASANRQRIQSDLSTASLPIPSPPKINRSPPESASELTTEESVRQLGAAGILLSFPPDVVQGDEATAEKAPEATAEKAPLLPPRPDAALIAARPPPQRRSRYGRSDDEADNEQCCDLFDMCAIS